MSAYETEEQQLDAIRAWWKENGRALMFGVVLSLAAILGGRYWFHYQHVQAESASMEYAQLLAEMAQHNKEAVMKRGAYIITSFAKTPYAALSALVLAKAHVAAGELAPARERLQWVIEHSGQPETQDIARLRLARVQLAEGHAQQALTTLATVTDVQFRVMVAEIKGDAYVAMNDRAAARTAYQQALESSVSGSDTSLLQMKLDGVGNGAGA